MPELPEVETVRRSLQERTIGAKIIACNVYFSGCIHSLTPREFTERVVGRRIDQWQRKGKYLVAVLNDGACFTVHLRMTGRLIITDDVKSGGPYTRLAFTLDDGRVLRFDDQRKFGRLRWFPDVTTLETSIVLGPDPTGEDFKREDLAALCRGRRRSVKSFLLDQTVLAGVGNIYADEALFRARILPTRPVDKLDPGEIDTLWSTLRDVLFEGISNRGTSMRDYVDSDGREGGFQKLLRVYGREGKPCVNCGKPIARVKVAGRSSFHCPRCQT